MIRKLFSALLLLAAATTAMAQGVRPMKAMTLHGADGKSFFAKAQKIPVTRHASWHAVQSLQ